MILALQHDDVFNSASSVMITHDPLQEHHPLLSH
jgi:hypothetical protein